MGRRSLDAFEGTAIPSNVARDMSPGNARALSATPAPARDCAIVPAVSPIPTPCGPMKFVPLFLMALLIAAPAAAADRVDAGRYSCRQFAADAAATTPDGYAAASEYTLVFLHVGLEAGGLPHHPITAEREAKIMGALRDLCQTEAATTFRLILVRYIQSATFRDWWSKLAV